MDRMQASPVVNDYALVLSKLLRGAKDIGNKVSLPVVGSVGDAVLGKAPEEVENWTYGNSPIAMPPMSNIPVVKTGRKEGLFDALMMAPTGGVGGAGHAGTLAFKPKHMHRIDDWVNAGMFPYAEGSPNTPRVMENLAQKADKLKQQISLWRLAHDPEEIARLSALKPGDLYEPSRITSTTRHPGYLDDVADAVGPKETRMMQIDAAPGTRIGGDLGSGNANFYSEFLLRPGAPLQYMGNTPDALKFKALTDSEANLLRRKAMIEALRNR